MKEESGKYLWRKNVDEGSAGELPHRFALLVSWICLVFHICICIFKNTGLLDEGTCLETWIIITLTTIITVIMINVMNKIVMIMVTKPTSWQIVEGLVGELVDLVDHLGKVLVELVNLGGKTSC